MNPRTILALFAACLFLIAPLPVGAGPLAAVPACRAVDAPIGCESWVDRYDGPKGRNDYAGDVVVSPDGSRVYALVSSIGLGTSYDYAVLAYDSVTGSRLWESRYNGPENGSDSPARFALSPDGSRLYVTGTSWGNWSTQSDIVTLALDSASGSVLWTQRFSRLSWYGSTNEGACCLAVSPDGSRVFVAGASNDDYAVLAYEASTGVQIWSSFYTKPNWYEWYDDIPTGLAVAGGGSLVVVTGWSWQSSEWQYCFENDDFATVAFDAATGAQAWVSLHGSPGNRSDRAFSIATSPDGETLFVAGITSYGACNGNPDAAYALVAYDVSTGQKLWTLSKPRADGYSHPYRSLAVAPDGSRVYFASRVEDQPGYFPDNWIDFLLHPIPEANVMAVNTTGGFVEWESVFGRPGGLQEAPRAVAASPDGAILYVTGETAGDIGTAAYDAVSGSMRWSTRLDLLEGAYERPTGIVVSSDAARLFVSAFAGSDWDGMDADGYTLAYDAD